jgi:hypothetical protein
MLPPSPMPGAGPQGMPPQGQPPMGSSPATGPTPNAGHAVKGNQIVGAALGMLSLAVPLVGPSSPLGQKLLKALTDISKELPPGSTTQAGENNALQDLMMKRQSMGPMMAQAQQGAAAAPPPQSPMAG